MVKTSHAPVMGFPPDVLVQFPHGSINLTSTWYLIFVFNLRIIPEDFPHQAFLGWRKRDPNSKVLGDLQRSGIKRSRIESPGRFLFQRNHGPLPSLKLI